MLIGGEVKANETVRLTYSSGRGLQLEAAGLAASA